MSGTGGDDSRRVSSAALVDAARGAWIAGNRADGERLKACYALFRECVQGESFGVGDEYRPGCSVVDPFDVCSAHLVAAFAISSGRADRMVSLAVDLSERYPAVLEALSKGRLDQQAAELFARQLRTVDEFVLARVQQDAVDAYLGMIESGQRPSAGAIRGAIDEVIGRYDADGVRLRRDDARRDRGVGLSKGRDGMSTLWATLTSEEAAVLAEKLDRRAAEFGREDDMPRDGLAERRADALIALTCGEFPGSPSATAGAASLRPKVTVIAPASGSGDDPVVRFPRTGESSVHALIGMLAVGDGASIERVDPTIGAYNDPSRFEVYRPPAALARAIRLRDGTCRHPGCTVSAEYCDLDHVVPFNHADPGCGGRTSECNLICLCRKHHRFKTFADWRYSMDRIGTLHVVAPDGTSVRTLPEGPLAEYRREREQDESEKWAAQQRRSPVTVPGVDPQVEPTYWHRRSARTRAERRVAARAHRAAREAASRTPPPYYASPAPFAPGSAPDGSPVSVMEQKLRDLVHPPPF